MALVLAATTLSAGMAQAGVRELELLSSYIGDWRGEGALVGGDQPEPFRCRLSVAQGNLLKINYTGRCSLVSNAR